ncbi:hypothetical protein Tco_0752031 [Tanacetum coccineum]|uniref:CCHC-type domain-containing protein n=1 Tax=Tanacetum coccineum TaxID=301880 RepID=A0ABQ4Z6N9_9ASTR
MLPRKSHRLSYKAYVNSSQSSSTNRTNNCCYKCGDSLDGIFCQRCTCKFCGKGAHIGYNCPTQVPIISNSEPCNNQTVNELPQALQSLQQQCLFRTCQQCGCNEYDGVCFYCKVGNGTPINVSTPYSSNDSPKFSDHPTNYEPILCDFCGNDARYGHYCTPQVPNPEPCYYQDYDEFPQTSPSFQQQYPCCENCRGPHMSFQCQPMNQNYYESNPCYDSNSFGYDQFQPPQYTVNHPIFTSQNELLNSQNELFNSQNKLLNSQNKLMEQMTSICDMDYTIAITPVLSTEEPVNSLSMGDEHLDTIPVTESDEFIKSSVEDLVPIPSESEGIPEMCDVPFHDNSPPLDISKDQFEDFSDSNDVSTSSDDDSFSIDDIEYVEASPLDSRGGGDCYPGSWRD